MSAARQGLGFAALALVAAASIWGLFILHRVDAEKEKVIYPLTLTVTGADHLKVGAPFSVGLEISNDSGHAVTIERGIAIETVANFKWDPVMAIEAASSCSSYDHSHDWHAQLRIEDGDVLKVVPFDGQGCGGQCTDACTANTRLGGGTYRFVVVTVMGERIPSPTFKLPGL